MKTKKLISLMLAVILSLGAVVCVASASEASAIENADIMTGDINTDGVIDTKDIILLRQYFANYDYDNNPPHEIGEVADMNNDNKISTLDIVALRKYLVSNGLLDSMVGETFDAEYAADFTVAKVFSDNMVVQRNEYIRVWGFAPESENGKKVSGSFKGMFAESLIENGEWCITFPARLKADVNGAEMKIYTDSKTVTFSDVLVGDVYLAMGQSNMNYAVSSHFGYDDPTTQGGGEAAIDENSIIRLNHLSNAGGVYDKMGTDYVYSDLTNTTAWTKTTVEDTKKFSAIGYYFAKQLTEKNPNVPVGMMQISKGGAPLVSFLPNDLADKWNADYLDTNDGKYYSNITREHMGRYFYNCYLAPISRYAIAGVVWYQGESNNGIEEAMKYNATFADLMTRLRSTHNLTNKDFPVFITELPSIYQKPADYSGSSTWYYMELGMIRSYMGSIPTVLENSYVAASSDLWNDRQFANNLHPNCKYEQAERLAAIANAVVYGKDTLDTVTGPVFKNATISEDKKTVVITFSNVGEGLATADGTSAVKGIVGLKASATGHKAVAPVSATITAKDQITVVFDTEVKAVAYNYNSSDFYGETINLCNSNGCIATGFISPYEEITIGTYKSEDFKELTYSPLNYKSRSVDTLKANGTNLFPAGQVTTGLAAAGNRVELKKGAAKLNVYGWAAFTGHPIIMYGYSIDGADAVFNSYPTDPGDKVLAAGGEHATRYSINIPINDLDVGDHTIVALVLVDVDGGIATKLLSFTLTIVEKEEAPEIDVPEGYDAPAFNESGYGCRSYSIDLLTVDGTEIKRGGVHNYFKDNSYALTVANGTKKIRIYGWIGYETTIDMFGYAVDGNAVIETKPGTPSDSVVTAGGENAKTFDVFADVSGLEAGYHTVDILVRINMKDGTTAVLKILSFTLTIEE